MEITKSEIKTVLSLHTAHGRKKAQLFLVEGPKLVEELLGSDYEISLLLVNEKWLQKNPDFENKRNTRLLSDHQLQKLSLFSASNQVMAVVGYQEYPPLKISDDELILVLDTIQDPGNLGTIIRTAEWFGIKQIVCSKETADAFNPKTVQASMGSVFRIRIHYTDLVNFLQSYSQMPVYGSLLSGDPIYDLNLSKAGFLIIGNESKGISPDLQKLITQALYIPKHESSSTESLNASVACGILLSAFTKK